MSLTVRNVGHVAPQLKQKIDMFQQQVDNNDMIVARIKEQLRSMEPHRKELAVAVDQRMDDRRNLQSALARLEDALNSFGAENKELESTIEDLQRILELVSLPTQQGFGAPGDASSNHMNGRAVIAGAIDIPLPYWEKLARQFAERTGRIWERVNLVEAALSSYSRPTTGAPVAGQIEAVVRSQHARFRDLAALTAQITDRLEQLREAAIRHRGVPTGMLARPIDPRIADSRYPDARMQTGGNLLGVSLGGMGMGGAGGAMTFGLGGAAPGGGLFGAPAGAPAGGGLFGAPAAGGGLFGSPAASAGGGLFGAPAAGGGLFGAPAGGGLFGAPASTGGGLFGAPAGGGLFGAPASTGGGLFGAPAGGGGLFGAPAGGGLFGK